jgi:hypothetical protein
MLHLRLKSFIDGKCGRFRGSIIRDTCGCKVRRLGGNNEEMAMVVLHHIRKEGFGCPQYSEIIDAEGSEKLSEILQA